MAYERPAWAGGAEVPQNMPQQKNVTVDVGEFIRTRDALTAAYLGLSASLDRAVKAYLDHTQVVLNGDASLNVSHLIQPFNVLTNHAQVAQMALQQQNGGVPPMIVANGAPAASEEPVDGKKKRKKRAYKPRDPNAPKRPLTAYFRFLGENRGTIAKEIQDDPERFANSGKPGDISRIATERWNALTKDEQEPYRAAYQAALKEYEKEVEKYKASGGLPEDLDETKVDESLVELGAQAGAATVDSDDSSDSDEEVETVAPPPPPPVKSPKKAAPKKSKPTTVAPAQVFSGINPENIVPTPAPAVAAASSSPDRKRRAATEGEGSSKKRGRKSGAAAEVVAAPDPVPVAAPVPVAPLASSPEVEPAAKKKKDKKKRKGGDA